MKRFTKVLLSLAPLVCVTGAFAADGVRVYVPFPFDTKGKQFAESQYEVRLSEDRNHLIVSSMQSPEQNFTLMVYPGGTNASGSDLIIRFDTVGDKHELRYIRLGAYEGRLAPAHGNSR